ncbi:MAG: FMN-binding protein [Thermoanaerobaculia bacterium]|nr:FMN-binding protein [Thermoanaerobaculia bacterium]
MTENIQTLDQRQAQSTSSVKLLLTLGVAGMLAGLLIVSVFNLTLPAIEANRAARLEAAIFEVLPEAETFTPLYFYEDDLVVDVPEGVDKKKLDRVFLGVDEDGSTAGYAIASAAPGFMDNVGLIFGYDPETQEVLGMKVLESKETPGLGSKIETETSFVDAFKGVLAPITGVKPGNASQPQDVEVITGATISSRTVIRAINEGIAVWGHEIDEWEERSRS